MSGIRKHFQTIYDVIDSILEILEWKTETVMIEEKVCFVCRQERTVCRQNRLKSVAIRQMLQIAPKHKFSYRPAIF